MNSGFLGMGLSMAAVALLAYLEANNLLVIFLVLNLVFFQLTLGTYGWVYLGQVNCDEGLSISTGVLWVCVLILSLYTNKMFSGLGQVYSFLIFSVISLISFVFFMIFMKETKGLSREESQRVYSKDNQVSSNTNKN